MEVSKEWFEESLKLAGVTHQHYKGGYYQFIGIGIHTETNERVVLYKHIWPNPVGFYVRPAEMFFGWIVDKNQVSRRRFSPVFGHLERLEDKTMPMNNGTGMIIL